MGRSQLRKEGAVTISVVVFFHYWLPKAQEMTFLSWLYPVGLLPNSFLTWGFFDADPGD